MLVRREESLAIPLFFDHPWLPGRTSSTDSDPASGSDRLILFAVGACFLLSGFAALLYQAAWLKKLGIVFGTSHIAVATVLAAYMAGLAAGAAIAARFAHRVRRPVLVYGVLEAMIGISALLVPLLLGGAQILLVAIYGSQPERGIGRRLLAKRLLPCRHLPDPAGSHERHGSHVAVVVPLRRPKRRSDRPQDRDSLRDQHARCCVRRTRRGIRIAALSRTDSNARGRCGGQFACIRNRRLPRTGCKRGNAASDSDGRKLTRSVSLDHADHAGIRVSFPLRWKCCGPGC